MSILILCFKVYLFSVFVGLAVYLFKRYGQPIFAQDLATKEREHQEVVSRLAVLTAEVAEQEKRLVQEKREIEIFKKKIDLWVVASRDESAQRIEEQKAYSESIAKRIEAQKLFYNEYKKRKTITPVVLAQMSNILEQEMAGQHGKRWLDSFIDDIEKEEP